MSIVDILAGCCPFLKNTSRAESDENLLNPDSNSLASDTETHNNTESSNNIQPDNNNNKNFGKNQENSVNNIKNANSTIEEDSDEEEEIGYSMHDLDDEFQQSECVKNLSSKLMDVIDRMNINSQVDFDNFKESKKHNQ